jgi:hypothetical protein
MECGLSHPSTRWIAAPMPCIGYLRGTLIAVQGSGRLSVRLKGFSQQVGKRQPRRLFGTGHLERWSFMLRV